MMAVQELGQYIRDADPRRDRQYHLDSGFTGTLRIERRQDVIQKLFGMHVSERHQFAGNGIDLLV